MFFGTVLHLYFLSSWKYASQTRLNWTQLLCNCDFLAGIDTNPARYSDQRWPNEVLADVAVAAVVQQRQPGVDAVPDAP